MIDLSLSLSPSLPLVLPQRTQVSDAAVLNVLLPGRFQQAASAPLQTVRPPVCTPARSWLAARLLWLLSAPPSHLCPSLPLLPPNKGIPNTPSLHSDPVCHCSLPLPPHTSAELGTRRRLEFSWPTPS